MKRQLLLKDVFPSAPAAPCWGYDKTNTIVCVAKGAARNRFALPARTEAVALETDGGAFRFPPSNSEPVCDWCVFTREGLRAYYVELKGSNFKHAVEQIERTLEYMFRQYRLIPVKAFAVLKGAHPSNARPGKANMQLAFERRHPPVRLFERSPGQEKPEDVVE